MKRRILVTGGFGYVGGRVAQSLTSQGDTEVLLGSRLLRSRPAWLPSAIPLAMFWNDVGLLRQACSNVDIIVHLAAMNEIEAARDPAGALEVNGVATARLMEAAIAEKVGRFIYISTAHVYGAPLAGLIDEAKCPRPVHPYATSHRAAEDVVLAAHAAGSLVGIVVRLSNSFGTPTHPLVERWSLLINDLCRQCVTTKQMVLRSSGLARRDFVTLSDAARAIAHLGALPSGALEDSIFNVGGHWAPRIMDVAKLVAERCDAIFGFAPPIISPKVVDREVDHELKFAIDKLIGSGFALKSERDREIDETLKFCNQTFAQKYGDGN
jgi:UDP-glucose 4-epimerase